MDGIAQARDRLLSRREALARLRSENALEGRALRDQPEPDWVDRSANAEERDLVETLADGEQRELNQIDAALARIAAGQYGLCTRCGEPLDPERLIALPETPLCLSCQLALERA